jgi:hypothetical protein
VTMNLNKSLEISKSYSWLPEADRTVVSERIGQLLAVIEAQPKPTAWNIRNKIGDRVKWYKEVQEVAQ